MRRQDYRIFTQATLGPLTLPNRLVRSATWDPCILGNQKMSDEVVDLYRELALGGVGLIITGGFPVYEGGAVDCSTEGQRRVSYDDLRVEGSGRLVEAAHESGTGCKIVAQLEAGVPGAGPSRIPSPYYEEMIRPLSVEEIQEIIDCFVQATLWMKEAGFDGVQLHAAHGGLLSTFLSSYTNRRDDEYGGTVENRTRIVREIISRARGQVSAFPMLIKVNCTDYLEEGIDINTFPALAKAIEGTGIDGIEISGGMWECLVRTEEELGFRPIPAAESHTRIHSPEKQSYFLGHAERLDLDVPVILVGGNRDVERLEQIVRGGKVDLIALCRPLINEPDLPRRWLEGRGSSSADCISCNACLYQLFVHPGRSEPGVTTCLFKHDREQYKTAQVWLSSWVEGNTVR